MNDSVKKRSKIPLLLVVVFVLPVVLAKFALDNDWFNKASTNKGELLTPSLDLSPITTDLEPNWRLLYVMPEQCAEKCENALYSLSQIWLALGKESDRVTSNVLFTEISDNAKRAELQDQDTLKMLITDRQIVSKVFKDVSTDGIFLVDTLGNIILRYQTPQEKQTAVMQSRDILADLKKLLKLSRIG